MGTPAASAWVLADDAFEPVESAEDKACAGPGPTEPLVAIFGPEVEAVPGPRVAERPPMLTLIS